MTRRSYVSFSVPHKEGKRFLLLLRDLDCADGWHESYLFNGRLALPHFGDTFDMDDPRFLKLLDLLNREGVKWSERRENFYTDAELRETPLLTLMVDRKPLDGEGIEYGTTYDLSNACKRCGTGAVQTSPLLMPLNALPKKGQLCQTARGDVLVGSELRQALLDATVSGLELRQVLLYRTCERVAWWQMVTAYEMPKLSARTKGLGRVERPGWGCMVCKRDMHVQVGDEPAELFYDRAAVNYGSLPDVVHTWECFGRSVIADDPMRQLVRGFALPRILLKPRVFGIFRKPEVKGACFEPVRIAD